MANKCTDDNSNWNLLLDSNNAEPLKKFLQYGINNLVQKWAEYCLIVDGKDPNNQDQLSKTIQEITDNIAKPLESALHIPAPISAILSICYFLVGKYHKYTLKKQATKVTDFCVPANNIARIFALVICDLCRMFEHQIILLHTTGSYDCIEHFAKAIIERAFNYILDMTDGNRSNLDYKKCLTNHQNMARRLVCCILLGKSEESCQQFHLQTVDGIKTFTYRDILDSLGIVIDDCEHLATATAYYYSSQPDQYIKYLGYCRSSVLLNNQHIEQNTDSYVPQECQDKSYHIHDLKDVSTMEMNYGSKITAIKNVKELEKFAIRALQCIKGMKLPGKEIQTLTNYHDFHVYTV